MFLALKVTVFILVVYATATAAPEDKAAMWQGLHALKRSVVSACSRANSPCTAGITAVTEMMRGLDPSRVNSDPSRRPIDGSVRPAG